MILSHKYKFIFIKNVRVASSSTELALSEHCGPDDTITKMDIESLRKSGAGPRNLKGMFNHIEAEKVKAKFPNEWGDYFKFATVRNPFDFCISFYWAITYGNRQYRNTFSKFLREKPRMEMVKGNMTRHKVNGNDPMNFILRYESIKEGLTHISKTLGMPPIKLPITKNYRPRNIRRKDFIEPNDRRYIETVFGGYMEEYNYSFDDEEMLERI